MLKKLGSHVRGNLVGYVALFIALGGTTYAATGGNFILGKSNSANNPTSLSAPVAGTALQLTNTSTQAGATALGLNVASGHSPFTVNSGAKVANLNADKLDSLDSSAFLPSSDVKPLVFSPGHDCMSSGDAGCSATFSLGGLSLAASCFRTNNGADAHLELDNTSATNQVGYEYVSATNPTQDVALPGGPIVNLDANPVTSQAQGTVIDLAAAKPETANFMAMVDNHIGSAVCHLWLVGTKPR